MPMRAMTGKYGSLIEMLLTKGVVSLMFGRRDHHSAVPMKI